MSAESRATLRVSHRLLSFDFVINATVLSPPNPALPSSRKRLAHLLDLASAAGFQCAATEWLGHKAEYPFECSGLEALQAEAAKHGGVCLSDTYEGTAARYRFRCSENHEWTTFGSVVLGGSWCLSCSRERTAKAKLLGIDLMHQAAAARGGRCLSTEYQGVQHKLEWLCERGHNWWTTPAVIRTGAWCPECARQARITRPKTKARERYLASTHHGLDSSP